MTFKMVCGNFLKINGYQDIYVSVILMFWKMILHNKIIYKTWSTKYHENSALL